MRRKLFLVALLGVFGAAVYGGIALATPPSGVTTTVFGVGRFDNDIKANTKTATPETKPAFWDARIKTKGASDLYVLQNTIAPGGTFGWHSHPGPSLVIVKSGTATFYEGNDRKCRPTVRKAGEGFLDVGDHPHIARNESSAPAENVVTYFAPPGMDLKIDAPRPGNCPF